MKNNIVSLPSDFYIESVDDARLPPIYENTKKAIAECARIDECKEWANKAEAMKSYARQSKDKTLLNMATRIQARAIRRCGELYSLVEKSKGGQPTHKTSTQDGHDQSRNRSQVAADAGMSERQTKTALRIANIPEEIFDDLTDSDNPPTITKLAELGKQERKPLYDLEGINPDHFKQATYIIGSLKRLLEDCEKSNPADIAKAIKEFERPKVREQLARLEGWLDRFAVNL